MGGRNKKRFSQAAFLVFGRRNARNGSTTNKNAFTYYPQHVAKSTVGLVLSGMREPGPKINMSVIISRRPGTFFPDLEIVF
ncbi:hypothetical protein Moror_13147 [Moniliophthora roreri MCA 2997]|uniref:Uncharacterized protein n=1 Tax=Moniliophthora roreri (strain MCA 2997) TaxID=1381753 RepID=V2WQ56_MONRO|nr:hypothetical protein Moror_13147 [Moniliophthora roreri MCA 2997]